MTARNTSANQSAETRKPLTTTEHGVVKLLKPKIDTSKLPPLESAADFLKRDIEPLRHPIKGIATEGVGLIAAREKTGKTWFCYQAGESVATGRPFLGHETLKGTCLYFDFETAEAVRQERLNIMFPDGTPENLYFISPPPDVDPWVIGEGFEEVLTHYLNQKPDTQLVVLDTLDFVTDDQKRNEAPKKHAYRNIRKLKAIAQPKHIAILCVMHFRKMSDPDDFLSNVSGSNGWTAAADYVIGITKKRGEKDAILQTDGRTCKSVEISITQDEKTMRWRQQGTLEQMMEQKRIEGFKKNDITRAIVKAVEMNNGSWTGTSTMLIGETLFDQEQEQELSESPRAITNYIRGTVDLFRKVYGLKVIDKNENNNKTSEWVISRMQM